MEDTNKRQPNYLLYGIIIAVIIAIFLYFSNTRYRIVDSSVSNQKCNSVASEKTIGDCLLIMDKWTGKMFYKGAYYNYNKQTTPTLPFKRKET